MIKTHKTILTFLMLMMIAGAFAKELPAGFKSWGTDIDPLYGKIAMPADWVEVKNKEKLTFSPDTMDKKRGYVLFKKHYMEPTSPYIAPRKDELLKDIRVFASTGEYEPASFLLYALRPVKKLNISVSDLRDNKTGAVIGAENIDLRSAVALPFKLRSANKKYKLRHEILVKRSNLNLKPEQTSLFWLTIYVPENSKTGTYRGTVTISMTGSTRKIPLLLRVFPIKLIAPDMEFGMYIGNHQRNNSLRQKIFIDMREHGMNTMLPCNFSAYPSWRNGKIELNFESLDRDMSLYNSAKFNKPVTIDMRPIQAWLAGLQTAMDNFRKKGEKFPADYLVRNRSFDVSPKFTDFEAKSYSDIVRKIVKHAETNSYPPLYFMAQEESTNKGVRIQQLNYFSKLLRKCGVKITSWSNAPWGGSDDLQAIDPYMDVRFYNYITPEVRERTKKSGDFFGIYNHGGRLAFGFFGHKSKAEGVLQWAYSWGVVKNMFSKQKGRYDGGKVYFGQDGPLPSPTWEEIREGIDDYKYINTLELLIKQNLKSSDQRAVKYAEQAQKVLNKIFKQVPDDTVALDNKIKSTDPKQWDVWRFKIIRQILKLQKDYPLKKKLKNKSLVDKKFISNITPVNSNKPSTDNIAVQAVEQLIIPYIKGGVLLDPTMKSAAWEKAAKTKLFALTGQHAWRRTRAIAAEQATKPGRMTATQTTYARMLYDDESIYIGFRCNEDQMNKIVANVKKRNGGPVWSDDAVEIFIKPRLGTKTYYQIAGNSLAVTAEMKWTNINGKKILARAKDKAWRPNFQVKSAKDKTGWNIVFKIPFKELGFDNTPGVGTVWRFNLGREEQPQAGCEFSSWSMVEKSFHEIRNWGMLFFGKVPVAMISAMTTATPKLGRNQLLVLLRNNKIGKFNGMLKVKVNGKSKNIPVSIKQKTKLLKIPYQVARAGKINIDLKLLQKGHNKPIFCTFGEYIAPSIINLELLQNEIVSGNTFQLLLDLNVSQLNLTDYYAVITLKKNNNIYKQKMTFSNSGKQKLTINTTDLPIGDYALQFTLYNRKNGKTVSINNNFSIIESIF